MGFHHHAFCQVHLRRQATHLIHHPAGPGLACAECAAQAKGHLVRPIREVELPTPTLLRVEQPPNAARVHICDSRLVDIGNLARCGQILSGSRESTVTVGIRDPRPEELCPACGAPAEFQEAAETYAAWRSGLSRRQAR